MKPAPFTDIEERVTGTSLVLVSKQNSGKPTTALLDSKGKTLWTSDFFVGRHVRDVSPDGTFLILSGSYYFGGQMNLSDDLVASIYEKGVPRKRIYFSELFAESAEALAKKRKLPVKGGDWLDRSHFISHVDVDWGARKILFTLYDASKKTVSFTNLGAELTKTEAEKIAAAALKQLKAKDRFILSKDGVRESDFGYVFSYAPEKYLKSRDPSDLVPGNGPLVVDRASRKAVFLTSGQHPAQAIADYQAEWRKKNRK